MGADRRGPLAAFVLIAVIAAILLVTSVRSQAQPGWLDPSSIPSTVVAAPPAVDSEVWQTVTDELGMVVEQGSLLMHKAITDPTVTADPAETVVVATMPASQGVPAAVPSGVSPVVRAPRHHARHTSAAAQPRHRTTAGPDRGGRTTAVSSVRTNIRASADVVTHGKGHAYGRSRSHGHGFHAHGHAGGRGHH